MNQMEKFLALQLNHSNKVPTIDVLLKAVGPSPNTAFYRIAYSLHFNNNLNPIYALVALRDIIGISPLNLSKRDLSEEDAKPSNSYRWLFLIHSLASKSITDDIELEKAKFTYVLRAYFDYIIKCDITKNYVVTLLSGVFCIAARLIDSCQFIPDFFKSGEIYSRILKLLNENEFPQCLVDIHDFSVFDLFSFSSPISLEYLSPTDLFANPKLLLSASILRLLYRILPGGLPQEIEEYKKIVQPLCVKGIVVDSARRVLIQLFNGDENEAYKYSDTLQHNDSVESLTKKVVKTKNFKYPLSYLESINLSENLSHIKSVAAEHPQHLITYLEANGAVTDILLGLLQSDYDSDFVIAAATILRIGEAKLSDMKAALNLLICSRSTLLREEISKLLLLQPEVIANQVVKYFPLVCNYGSRSDIFFAFLTNLIQKVTKPTEVLKTLINSIYDETEEIKKLPNSHIYIQLSQFIEVPASYLDPQPCTVCNNPERQATKKNLQDFKEYYKYTHDQIFVKLKQPHIIQTFSLSLSIKKRSRLPRTVKVYVSSAEINNQNELMGDKPNWYHVAELNFSKDSTSATTELPLRLFATCLQFHFTEFWEDTMSVMTLTCPVCRSEITDRRSGLCSKCKENAYQCRECRSINYNHLDSFICSECGFSNFVSFTWTITALPSFSHTHILTESDCDASLKKCDELLAEAHTSYEALTKLQNEIGTYLSPACSLGLNGRTSKLNSLYNTECKSKFQSLTAIVQHVCAIRSAISAYKKRSSHSLCSSSINMCYNCRSTYIKNCLQFFTTVTKFATDETLEIPKLLFSFLNENSIFTSTAVDSLVAFCSAESELTLKVVDTFEKSLPNVPTQLVRLLCELENVNDSQRSNRLTIFIKAIQSAVKFKDSSSSFTPLVLQPLFNTVANSPLLIRTPQMYAKFMAFNTWSTKKKAKMFDPLETIISQEFCMTLFTECSSHIVRHTIALLCKDTSTLSQSHFKAISSMIISTIEKSNQFNQYDSQLYKVLTFLLKNKTLLVHTLQSSFFDHIIDLLCGQVDSILSSEENITLNLSVGLSASVLMDVVKLYLEPIANLRYVINKKNELVVRVFTAYFKLRSLLIQRSKFLDNSLSTLKDIIMRAMLKEFILDKVEQPPSEKQQTPAQEVPIPYPEEEYYSDSEHEDYPPAVVTPQAAIPAPASNPNLQEDAVIVPNDSGQQILLRSVVDVIEFCPDIVIREVTSVIFPPKQVEDIPVLLQKQPSQEDYIPGRLPSHSINSTQIGETFKDIKLKICNDLNMLHLIEDDHGMELLVDHNIISLSLPISEVYQRIWAPNHGRKPMVVLCRLQGLDGEATEPMIESFPSEETDDEPPEVKYSYTKVLCENNGFEKFLNTLNSDSISDVALNDLVKLLETFALVQRNREEMNKLNTIDRLFDLMKLIVSNQMSADLMTKAISITSTLIYANRSALHDQDKKVNFIFESLEKPMLRNNSETLLSPFLSLIPPLAEASKSLSMTVLSYFLKKLKPTTTTTTPNATATTPTTEPNTEPITTPNTEPNTEPITAPTTEPTAASTTVPTAATTTPPTTNISDSEESFNFFENSQSLFMLNGFAEFTRALPPGDGEIRDLILHEPIVKDAISYLERLFPISENRTSDKWKNSLEIPCLPMLLKFLAGMVSSHKPTQELFIESDALLINLLLELEAVSSAASIGEFASQVLHNACVEPSICASVVEHIKNDHQNCSKQRAIEMKEKALQSAKQNLSPEYLKMMGELGDQSWECCICKEGYESEPKEQLGVYVYSNRIGEFANTATYFVCVHPSCHSKDKNQVSDHKGRLREWDAAMVRNCERPCNTIFPLPFSSIALNQYKANLTRYFDDGRSRSSLDYFKMLFFDVKMHLETISRGEKIPLSVGGGSQSSIFELIPFLIYAGHLFLDAECRRTQESRLQHLVDNISEAPHDTAVLSLWILSIEEWEFIKIAVLKAMIKSVGVKPDDEKLFGKLKNEIILYVLINRMHPMLYPPSVIQPVKKDDGKLVVRDHRDEQWRQVFYDRANKEGFQLGNEFLDFAGEVEDEILEVSDFKSALIYAEVSEAAEDPLSWIKGAI